MGPGTERLKGRTIQVKREFILEVPRPEIIQVLHERHDNLPLFNNKLGGWMQGARLNALITQECSATGLLIPNSVVVKSAPGPTAPYKLGRDYQIDPLWATVGRLPNGQIGPDQPVYIDYRYSPNRLDSIAVDEAGKVSLIKGRPAVEAMDPPVLPPGYTDIANIWVPGLTEKLSGGNLFPIEPQLQSEARNHRRSVASQLLPKTLAKLRAGKHVTIVAWGDSVTAGGGVGDETNLWYQNRFAAMLRKRFPKAMITMKTAAWPGGNSRGYLDAPPGSQYNFQRDVLDVKPDLVTVEFVNDAYMNEAQTFAEYTEIMDRLTAIGSEVILITPHLVRPDWMGVTSLKFNHDPRPYVIALRKFAQERHIALADVSAAWCRLWREGIPYVTLLANSINHPDARGHEIYARALIDLFPKH
ncbi:MAG: GDSL-type esterase/lipase family protein [Armatimonadetes bacterium]|nr:GDSL-type esterase/lipase family protein [Armatimonadota bacterium]